MNRMNRAVTPQVTSAKKAEAPLLETLIQEYLAEFARFEAVEQDDSGRYVYPYLPHYWEDPNRYPFLFRLQDQVVGFALLRFEVDPVVGNERMELAEFFVREPFRRRGMGTRVAEHLWNLFPGRWVVRVLRSNRNAYPFWQQAIDRYTGAKFNESPPETAVGGAYTFTFESRASPEMPDDVEPDILDY